MTDVHMDTAAATAPTEEKTDLTTDEVLAKIDELVNLANYLKRVAKPMVKKYAKKRTKTGGGGGGGGDSSKRNGFAVPVVMAPQLISFLNEHCGTSYDATTELPRTTVTSAITTYIKTHELQTPENKKNFTVDAPLASVFGVEKGEVSNWFEMQKYLTRVVTSAKKRAPAAAATTDEPDAPAPASARSTASAAAAETKGGDGKPPGKRIKRG